ncbi:AraC family transcriptional regulator [Actinacidiphila acidipaludis]|uniref:AraC family transcriptional regulator n=1 Tax=Actinacidiphila acidipaludis TaxID=2873382 RepID=A0ABS7QCJ0_9ACTN|nr:AraC family transcriptional regulator [Streptomyces acidipaludis]MBY8880140.1 AraC family transcriptional regulator [Streptomyces acidipaludis]
MRRMDAISTLIRMARLEAGVDVRCLLAGAHVLDNPPSPPGDVPFHILLEGTCLVETDARPVELRAGDVLVLPRAGRHRVRVKAGEPPVPADRIEGASVATVRSPAAPSVDLFCGHFAYRPGAGELLFAGLPEVLHASFGTGDGSPLRLLGELMRNEAASDGPGAGALLASLCEALLALVLRGDGGGPGAASGVLAPWTAVVDPGLRAVVDAVVHEPQRPWTIAALARVAGVSRATLVRHFSAATGMGVADFLTRTRMTVAADLLTTTGRSLEDIAASVGYRSPSAFGRAFRDITGTTPARWRRAAADRTR